MLSWFCEALAYQQVEGVNGALLQSSSCSAAKNNANSLSARVLKTY